jgi:hypothetical protein
VAPTGPGGRARPRERLPALGVDEFALRQDTATGFLEVLRLVGGGVLALMHEPVLQFRGWEKPLWRAYAFWVGDAPLAKMAWRCPG